MAPGRNDPCPCGSGRRYKHCCGQIGAAASQAAAAPLEQASGLVTRSELLELVPLLQTQRFAELERRAREFTDRDPDCGGAWKALGVALELQRKDAIAALDRATRLLPTDAEAHANLGAALLRAGRAAESIASLRRALEIRPQDADTHTNLGNARRAIGELELALASYQAAVGVAPDRAELHGNLGNLLLQLGRPREAVDCYESALALQPTLPDWHQGLATALHSIGRPDAALLHAQRAVALAPASAEARSTLGNVLLDFGRFEEAEMAYRTALQSRPDFADALGNLAMALRLEGRSEEAMEQARKALEINPRSTATLTALADTHADRGEFAQAEQRLREAIAIDPDEPQAWAGLAHLRRMGDDDAPWLAQALRIVGKEHLAPRLRALLHYAIGKYFDDLRQYSEAFAHYRCANEISRRHRAPYDRMREEHETERLVRVYNRQWLETVRQRGVQSDRPVLIVGMPRSGTSLVEQILASHPAVWGAGELPFWHQAAAEIDRQGMQAAGSFDPRPVARDYLKLLEGLSADAARVVDKMPENFRHLGLIHAALPGAHIVHIYRHPIDTCLSIYFQDFKASLAYANDLGDLAHLYGQYWRLMRHWRTLLPAGAMLEIPYEGLVTNTERWAHSLLQFVALPWDARCLDFQATRRNVVTASKWQVRQKIGRSSVGRWRHYEPYVGELLPLLALWNDAKDGSMTHDER